MFWRKQVGEKVKCEECKLYTDKSDAQKVTTRLIFSFCEEIKTEGYYCKAHKVPYDECVKLSELEGDSRLYYKRMKVDKDGTPFGYKKLKM